MDGDAALGGRAKRAQQMGQSSSTLKVGAATKSARSGTSKPPGLPKPASVVSKVRNTLPVLVPVPTVQCTQRPRQVSSAKMYHPTACI